MSHIVHAIKVKCEKHNDIIEINAKEVYFRSRVCGCVDSGDVDAESYVEFDCPLCEKRHKIQLENL